MLLGTLRSIFTSATLGSLVLTTSAAIAAAAPGMTATVVPSLALCVSPGVLFGVAFSAPMAMLLVGFFAVFITDRAG